jgi:hypothetical protein
MENERHERYLIKRGGLAVAIIVLLTVALAAPALAAAPTEWTVSPTSTILTYGQGVILNGTLMSNGAAVGGLWVDFAQATTTSGSYEVMYKVTAPTGPYATGTYSIAVIPMQTMYYRFQWEGDADYLGSASDTIPVQVKPSLGKPSCPSKVKKSKKFTIKGSVKPGQGVSPAVKIKSYRKKANGAWVGYKTYGSKVSGTQYKASIKITRTGKFKFKASTGNSAAFAAGLSSYSRVLTVKK